MCDSFRCEGDVSRSDSNCAETRNQSGHPILCDECAAQLVQRWESLLAAKQNMMSLFSIQCIVHSPPIYFILCVTNFWIWPLRRWPQARHAPNCHGNVWSDGGSSKCFWKYTSGCGEDQDAGRNNPVTILLLSSNLPFLTHTVSAGFGGPPLQKHSGLRLPDLEAGRTTGVSNPDPDKCCELFSFHYCRQTIWPHLILSPGSTKEQFLGLAAYAWMLP